MKDNFRIEVNKIPVRRSGAENVDCTSKWPFFDVMLFVKDTILPSPTTGNLPHSAPSLPVDDDSEDYTERTLYNDNTAGDCTTICCNSVTSINRPWRRWDIKMDLGETGFGHVDWINLAQDRDRWRALVNTVMNLRVP
jgi:hypothetical protein